MGFFDNDAGKWQGRKPGKKFGAITDKATGREVEVRVYQDEATGRPVFWCEVEGLVGETQDYAKLEAAVLGMLGEPDRLTWTPVLFLYHLPDRGLDGRGAYPHAGGVYLSVERKWLAQREDGRVLVSNWNQYDPQAEPPMSRPRNFWTEHVLTAWAQGSYPRRETPLPFDLPWHGHDLTVTLYREGLYQNLRRLAEGLELAGVRLQMALRSQPGIQVLDEEEMPEAERGVAISTIDRGGTRGQIAGWHFAPAEDAVHVGADGSRGVVLRDAPAGARLYLSGKAGTVAEVLTERTADVVYLRVVHVEARDAEHYAVGGITRRAADTLLFIAEAESAAAASEIAVDDEEEE